MPMVDAREHEQLRRVHGAGRKDDLALAAHHRPRAGGAVDVPGLKDSVGERSNHSNFRHQNSVKIRPGFRKFCKTPLEIQHF